MIQAINGKIPEKRFIHDKELKNKYNNTVRDILLSRKCTIPPEWG